MTTSHGPDRSPVDWLFRDRQTGRIVVMQWPNIPLWLFIIASAVKRITHPTGGIDTVISVVAGLSLLTWSALEIAKGVNPFRRILGAVVLLVTIAGLVLR